MEIDDSYIERSEGGCFWTYDPPAAKERTCKWSPERRAKQREANRRYQAKFRARENACHTCGKPLSPMTDVRPNGQPFVSCAACRQRDRARYNVKVGRRWGGEVERRALPFPVVPGRPAEPMQGSHTCHIILDHTSHRAIERLLYDWREAERAAGRIPAPGQIGRIVREAIKAGAGRMGPIDLPRTMKNPDLAQRVGVRLDDETWLLLEREALRLRVSRSEAARALLYLAAFPPEGFRESLYPREITRFYGDGTGAIIREFEDGTEEYVRPYVRHDPVELRRRLAEQEAAALAEGRREPRAVNDPPEWKAP